MTYIELSAMCLAELNAQPCKCVPCRVCDGMGMIKVDSRGRFIDYHDDLYDLEPCDQCEGGCSEVCDRCSFIQQIEQEKDYRVSP